MKKWLCLITVVMSIMLCVFWLIILICSDMIKSYSIFNRLINYNYIFIFLCVIIGCLFIKVSVEDWFIRYRQGDLVSLPISEKRLLIIVIEIVLCCIAAAMIIMLSRKLSGDPLTLLDSIRFDILKVEIFNLILFYASYQTYNVLR